MLIQYIRSIFFSFVALPIWTMFICTALSPMLLLPRASFMALIHLWANGVTQLEKYILGITYEVRGWENMPKDQNCIIASKHQSTYETFKVHQLFKDAAVILKRELFFVPFWGLFLLKSGVIAIDRSNPRKAMKSIVDGAKRVADEGRTIIIYPQGTRVKPEDTIETHPYKQGVYRVYEETKLPVIPLAINSGCYWPRGQLLKRSGKIIFEFHPALDTENMDKVEFLNALSSTLETRSNLLAEEAKR